MTRSAPKLAIALLCLCGAWTEAARGQPAPSTAADAATTSDAEAAAPNSEAADPPQANGEQAAESKAPTAGEAPAAESATDSAAGPAPGSTQPAPRAQPTAWKPTRPPPAIAAPPAPLPPAKDGRFVLAASFTPRWNSDPSYDFVADDDVTMAYGLWLGYDLLRFAERFALAAELGWSTEYTEQGNLAGGALDTELRTCAWELSADVRWEATSFLWPHLRIGGGLIKDKLHLDSGSDGEFEDTGLSGTFSAGVGATFKTPAGLFRTSSGRLASLSLGVRVEAGYRLMGPTAVTLTPADDDDDASIPAVLSDLGEVSRSGPYLGISLVGRI